MPRNVSIAFQGGGARLVPLIAAAHAISELEGRGDLRVQAVSGSSAGSLAAFLLAAKADFDKIAKALRAQEANIQAKFPPLSDFAMKVKFALFILFGWSIYKPAMFNEIITEVLNDADIDATKTIDQYVRDSNLRYLSRQFHLLADKWHDQGGPSQIVRNPIHLCFA
jgi:predicted acylesterase/phospholipase RssA